MANGALLENLVHDLGGCGLYQILLATIVHFGKTIATWSMITMAFAGQNPGFYCTGDNLNGTDSIMLDFGSSNDSMRNVCNRNGSKCVNHVYDEHMRTVVSEFDLVCDRKWVTATITTIQMGGVLLGCLVIGHLADLLGRKPSFFGAIFITVVFNAAGYFSTTWEMFAAMRFIIGIGIGSYLTVQYSLTNEFVSAKWRPVIVATPSWPLQGCLFALAAWGLHDWKSVHLAIAVIGAPFLLTWFIVPESFRWLVTKQKFKKAETVVSVIARVNKTMKPDLTKIFAEAKDDTETSTNKRYSLLDMFHTKEFTKITVGLAFAWFAASFGYYGITFGVKSLSGDIYLNMFLINAVEVPVVFLTAFLVNWFGRKKVCFGFYVLSGITGIIVGVIQYKGLPVSGQITNGIALTAKLGVAGGWQAMILYTTEIYPTVIRTIAFGVHSTAARVGGMLAPQIVFLDSEIPGILYFMGGVLMVISAACMLLFRETKDTVLEDTLDMEVKIVVKKNKIQKAIKLNIAKVKYPPKKITSVM